MLPLFAASGSAAPSAAGAPAASPTGGVEAANAPGPTPVPTTITSITPLQGGGGGAGGGHPVGSSGVNVETAASLGGSAALLGMAVAWRVLRPRRRAPGLAAAAVATGAGETALFRIWKDEIDDLADLAALTVPPEELPVARQRRRAFSADALARRLTRSVEHMPEGT